MAHSLLNFSSTVLSTVIYLLLYLACFLCTSSRARLPGFRLISAHKRRLHCCALSCNLQSGTVLQQPHPMACAGTFQAASTDDAFAHDNDLVDDNGIWGTQAGITVCCCWGTGGAGPNSTR
jgi:hypothetical protein